MDDFSVRQRLQGELLSGERILWVGQPDPSILLSRADIFLVPFSVMWGGFALLFAGIIVAGLVAKGGSGGLVFPLLWAIPFLVVGQYMIWGRFVYKHWRKRRTFYAVTNQRVLVVSGAGNGRLQGAFISQIPVINRTLRKNGTGTVEFGSVPYQTAMYANTGMDFFGWPGNQVPVFYDIRDAQRTYNLVLQLRRDMTTQQSPAS